MPAIFNRRRFLQRSAAAALAPGLSCFPDLARALSGIEGNELGPALPFSFEGLQQAAKKLSLTPYEKAVVPSPETLDEIDYDQYQMIHYRPEIGRAHV